MTRRDPDSETRQERTGITCKKFPLQKSIEFSMPLK